MRTEKYEYTPEDMGIEGNVVRGVTLVKPAPIDSVSQASKQLGNTVAHAADGVQMTWEALSGGAANWDEYVDDLNKDAKAVKDAFAAASEAFWQGKLDNIKALWNDTTEVSIQAMVQTITPYTQGAKFFDRFEERLQNLAYLLAGVEPPTEANEDREKGWSDILKVVTTEYATAIAVDDGLADAASELSFIQGAAQALKSYSQFVGDVQNFLGTIEPILPYAELAWAWASSLMTGGASVAVASGKTLTAAQKALYDLLALALHDVKEMIFQWKIRVPTLLVESVQIMTVQEASYKFTTGSKMLDELLSDDYYKTITDSLVWRDAVSTVSKKIGDTDVHNYVISASYIKNDIARAAMSNILSKAYADAKESEKSYQDVKKWIDEKVAQLRQQTDANNSLNLSEDDIIQISGYIIED